MIPTNNKIIKSLCIGLCVLSLTGCGENNSSAVQNTENSVNTEASYSEIIDTPDDTDIDTESNSETDSKSDTDSSVKTNNLKEYERLGVTFLNAVKQKDWDAVISCLALRPINFVNAEDLEWVLPRTALIDLADKTDDVIFESSALTDNDAFVYTVKCSVGSDNYDVSVKLMDDNTYKVLWKDAIIHNWEVHMPDGCTIDYKGNTYSADDFPDTTDWYGVPQKVALASAVKRPMDINATNRLGDTVTRSVIYDSDAEYTALVGGISLTEERAEEVIRDAFNVYSKLFTALENEAPTEEILTYLSSDWSIDGVASLRETNSHKPNNNEFRNYTFRLDRISDECEARIVGGNDFYVWVAGTYGTYESGYGRSIREKTYEGRPLSMVITYEDGKAKFKTAPDAIEYMFARFGS